MTPLHFATYGGHVECVRTLLAAKADVHAATRFVFVLYAMPPCLLPRGNFSTIDYLQWSFEIYSHLFFINAFSLKKLMGKQS